MNEEEEFEPISPMTPDQSVPLDKDSAFRATFFGIPAKEAVESEDKENKEIEDEDGDGEATPTGEEAISPDIAENIPETVTKHETVSNKNNFVKSVEKKSSDDESSTEEVGSDTETIDVSIDIDVNSMGKMTPEPEDLGLEDAPGGDRYYLNQYNDQDSRKCTYLLAYMKYLVLSDITNLCTRPLELRGMKST